MRNTHFKAPPYALPEAPIRFMWACMSSVFSINSNSIADTFSHSNARQELDKSIEAASKLVLSHRHSDGYWWYTLEANDTIGAEMIFLHAYLGINEPQTMKAIANWILCNQRQDGSWAIFTGADGDLSTTVECYLALKIAGYNTDHPQMQSAREFILRSGGITRIRIFSRIHLALLGLVDWNICPQMPVSFMRLPRSSPISIYEFSSWARACIVPLLVVMDQKRTVRVPGLTLDELYLEQPAKWPATLSQNPTFSLETFFVQLDKALLIAEKMRIKPLRKSSLKLCEQYILEHLSETEDIFPAMFYGVLALIALGYKFTDAVVQKGWLGLKSFQLVMSKKPQEKTAQEWIEEIPFHDASTIDSNVIEPTQDAYLYQQCCVSPVWDTAWAAEALLEAGLPPFHPDLLATGRWLIKRQITDCYGDWSIKNKGAAPGGWSFEFYNKHYPDVDDTIEILTYLYQLALPYHELREPFDLGLKWLLSMQSSNGGFAAFDRDNNLEMLNKIPFADHGACLDPPTVDLTGRVIEFIVTILKEPKKYQKVLTRAANFISKRQERDGSFFGRWGVAYLYGTWCVVSGLAALGRPEDKPLIERAVNWLRQIQNSDGGFGESCDSYCNGKYSPLGYSIPSQTAWGLMTLVAAGYADTPEAKKAADFLMQTQRADGGWDEVEHTGTGFPGHFYIRYHGYRYYFPLMALARYRKGLR